MTITLDLTTEEEAALAQKARAEGLDIDEYLKSRIKEMASETTVTIGAQIVAEWERAGVIGYRKDIQDSQAHARMLREKAQRRDHEKLA